MFHTVLFPLMMLAGGSAVGASPDFLKELLPTPQLVEMRDGVCAFDLRRMTVLLRTPSEDVAARMGEHVGEVEKRLGMTGTSLINECPSTKGFALAAFSGDSAPAIGEPTFYDEAKAEGYELTVSPDGVSVSAATEQGLFYGLMTLEQLFTSAEIRHERELPCMRIADWPRLGMRGFHEDYGRDQLPTIDDQKRTIRTLAQYKMNTHLWFIEPDHFVYKFDPEIGKDYDRFTFDEIREVVAYAKKYYIEVIPVVESLAHMENTLNNPKYAGLAEVAGSGTLCPASDESFALIRNIIDEIAEAFDGKYFHCGLDESSVVGQGKSAEAVKEKGIERVYADYYTRLDSLVKGHGKTMMMYADIVLNHPKVMDLLPKDIIMMYWDYGDAVRHPGFDTLAKSGFKTVSLSAVWDWVNLYPVYGFAFKNIERLAAQSAEVGALGTFTADWGDPNLGAGGANLSELNYYGVVYLGAQAWRPEAIPFDAFSKGFAVQFFGLQLADSAEAFTLLAKCQGDTATWVRRARMMFHGAPHEQIPVMAKASEDELAFWRQLKASAAKAHYLLLKGKAQRNADYVRSYDLAARMLEFAADMALECRAAAEAMRAPRFVAEDYARAFEKLSERQQEMWKEYREVYAATNRPMNLKYLAIAWEKSRKDLADFAADLRNGKALKLVGK